MNAPDPPGPDLARLREQVLQTMQRRHVLGHGLAWGMLILGGLVILFAGVIVSFLLTFISFSLNLSVGLRTWFILYFALIVPLLVWQERRTRGGFFTLAVADVDLTRDPDNVGEFVIRRTRTHAIAFAEMLLWGPRAFLAGFRALRGIRETGLDRVLPEAADTLTLMLSLDGGVKIRDLAGPGNDPMMLMPVLKWLDQHDYIGISSRGDRVWVSTIARNRLVADHGPGVLPKVEKKAVVRGP